MSRMVSRWLEMAKGEARRRRGVVVRRAGGQSVEKQDIIELSGRPDLRFIRDGPPVGGLMSWMVLFCAGILEIVFAVSLRQVAQSPNFWLYVLLAATIPASMYLLSWSMREIPLGTAYAVWTGIGAIGTFISGIVFFSETPSAARLISALFVLIGLIGLKLSSH